MISGIIKGVLSWFGGLFYRVAALYAARRSGREAQKLDNAKESLENVEKAHKAIGHAKSNPSIGDRLRKRYGIK